MNLYYKMLRRQYKKRRNKKGGRNFFDAVSQGAEQWKSAATIAKNKGMEAAANTQQGFADFEASRKANLQRSMMAGEYSDLAKNLMRKNIEKNPLGLAKQRQLAANLRGDRIGQLMIENRNPNLSPRKLRRFNPKEGGKRKSRRRKKSRKRKTRRKRRGGMPAPMAYKKRVDRQEIGNQTELFNLMKRAKMRGDTNEQEKLKKKMKKSFDRMNFWNTPEAKANKERILESQVTKAMPGIEAAIKAKTLVPRKTRQTRSASAGRKKRKTRRKRRR